MQITNFTPAESLLKRLLGAEKLKNTYLLSLHEEEHFTDVFVQHRVTETENLPPLIKPLVRLMFYPA